MGSGGAQTVERASQLLRLVAVQGAQGARLLDLAEVSGLARPTVHRLLRRLCDERLLMQDVATRRYRLGTLLYELGLAAPSPVRRIAPMRPILQQLAERTGDTAYLVMRSGDEAVCLHLEEGGFPIRARTFEIGARRPLGLGAAGLALLAAMPAGDADEITERNRERLMLLGLDAMALQRRLASARTGAAVSRGTITEGVSGIAVAVPPQAGAPYLAVSVAAISSRMPDDRLPTLQRDLEAVASRIAVIERAGA